VLGIVFIAMALKAKAIAGSPQLLLYVLAPLVIIYALNFLISTVVGKLLLPRNDAIALVYGSVMRNLSIALAIAINAFGPQGSSAALVVAMAYIIQVQSAAWYVKYADAIFGKPDEGKAPAGVPTAPSVSPQAPKPAAAACAPHPPVPTFRKILYATDLSETARHAVRYACSMGSQYAAQVQVLHVVPDLAEVYASETGIRLKGGNGNGQPDALNRQAIDEAMQRIQERIRETASGVVDEIPHCPLTTHNILVKVGDPAQQIVETATTGNYDLVIMGTHGHSKLDDLMLGSVARDVVHSCPIPVLTVRLPA
jgi:nucleotide-binding universal stress UspA family protein